MKRLLRVPTFMVVVLMLGGCESAPPDPAVSVVTRHASLDPSELRSMDNPSGEGVYVYRPDTRYGGVERNFVWLVIDDRAFPLNSPSKELTQSLPWPREAPDNLWSRTGLNKFNPATEAIRVIWGG